MRRLLVLLALLLLTGCGRHVEANYPASPRQPRQPITVAHLPEDARVMVDLPGLVLIKPREGGWFDPVHYRDFLRERDEVWRSLAARQGADPDLFLDDVATKHRARFRMLDEQGAPGGRAFLVLGLLLDAREEVTFREGCLRIELVDDDGRAVHVEDQGILLERVTDAGVTLFDTAAQPVTFTNRSLHIDYDDGPYPLWVRVPGRCRGMAVASVAIVAPRLTIARR